MKSRISTRGPPLTPGRKLGLDHLSRDNFAPIELVQSASQLGDLFFGEVRIRGGAMFTDAQGDGVLDKFILSATKLTGDAFEFGVQFVGDVDLGHGSAPFGQYNAALSHPIRAWMGYPPSIFMPGIRGSEYIVFLPTGPLFQRREVDPLFARLQEMFPMDEPQAVSSVPLPPPTAAANSGLSDSAAGAIAYLTFIPAVLFLILDPYKNRPFVRFNAFQCLGLYVVAICFSFILIIPILGWIVGILGDLTLFVFWIMCIIKAANGQLYKMPVVGKYVEQLAASK